MTEAEATMGAFINAINTRDLPTLTLLMPPDHTFVDAAGESQVGGALMVGRWAEFFRLFQAMKSKSIACSPKEPRLPPSAGYRSN